jgi:Flp pilus assembly protein TadD
MVQKGDCRQALLHLTRAVELGDRDGRNLGLLGYCHLENENYVAAESAYRDAVLQESDTMDWQLGLARALLAMEQYREAAALFASLIDQDPTNANAWMLQANAFLGLEQPDAAAVNLEAVRMLGKAQPSSLVLLGDIYMNRGIPELAKSAYLEVVAGDAKGEHFGAAYRAAELLVRTRAWGEAEEVLASIARRYPKLSANDELKVLTLRAKLARAQGRDQEAAKLLESIVERDGTRGDALLELAAYHHEKGDDTRALLQIERAQRLDAFEYQALLDHAQIMVSAKDYAKAAELLREALEIRREPRVERFLARVEQAIRP